MRLRGSSGSDVALLGNCSPDVTEAWLSANHKAKPITESMRATKAHFNSAGRRRLALVSGSANGVAGETLNSASTCNSGWGGG